MKKLFAFLASLRLAVILLVLMLLGLALGTIVETRSNADTAGRLVYYAWWFLGLQALFALNLAMSLADLFPWVKKRTGFVVVHASLLLILAGSTLTYLFKVEGSLAMWEGDSASIIEAHDPEGKVISRHQLPFSVKLEDFVLDTYPGTNRPSGFSSQVLVTDQDTGRTFPARIWMNHELKHRGYALFQSSYEQRLGREATVLSVSKDPGQPIVFIGFITLVAGLLIVLGTRLAQNLEAKADLPDQAGRALLLALALLGAATPAAAADLESLRRLPVQHDGRIMPLDTLARDRVWTVTGTHSWKGRDAVAILEGWLADPKAGSRESNILIGSKELADKLGLSPGTTHASFVFLLQNQALGELILASDRAQAGGKRPAGLLQDVGKLKERILVLKDVLIWQAVRPLPQPLDAKARWEALADPSLPALTQLMAGPRLQGWPAAEQIEREVFYNRLNPFRLSWLILLASLLAAIAAWVRQSRTLDRIAFACLAGGFGMTTWGLLLRWQVGDRIPAANMYESMLFLAWGVGLFAVIANGVARNRLVVLNAAVMAALTLALADLLPIDRLIHPIAPVLAGTPWLAIHVPIIMVGYAVLALGLVVAHMQVGVSAFAPERIDLADRMYELLYWYMFVGSIFLVAGIITGAMWAASSWGRYWGWDPKEVWSLVAFLAYMAILHAKLDRMIGRFGVAVVSILAFQTILMTYLGVNFVLVTGMHSYGMGDSPVVMWMVAVAMVEVAFLGYAAWVVRRRAAVKVPVTSK